MVVALVQAQFKVLKLGILTLNVISLTSYKKSERSENLNGNEMPSRRAFYGCDHISKPYDSVAPLKNETIYWIQWFWIRRVV